jgi:hypothetical protein
MHSTFLAVDKVIVEEGVSTVNSTIANNTATDNDLGLNGTIEYTIADGNSEVCNLCSVYQCDQRTFLKM